MAKKETGAMATLIGIFLTLAFLFFAIGLMVRAFTWAF